MEISTELVSAEYLHVNSCGIQRLFDRDYHTLRARGRLDYHLLYIAEGCCRVVNANEEEVLAPEGSIVLFLPGQRQQYSFLAADRSVSCYLHFTGVGCASLITQTGLTGQQIVQIGKSATVEALFEQMVKEYTLKKPFYDSLLSALLMELFARIGRRLASRQTSASSKSQQLLDEVCLRMHREYAQNHPMRYYADACSLSLSRFSHLFRASVGVSPLEYINRIRIAAAKELLLNTSLSVSEISSMVGFSDQNYFGRLFRKHTGQSPRQFAHAG